MDSMNPKTSAESIESRIYALRGLKVMLSSDLAVIYGVEPRALAQAVRRNRRRFPDDFMIQLAWNELRDLKSQIVISSWGGARTPPYGFTQEGVAMLSSVLRSRRAIDANIAIMRAFVRMRAAAVLQRRVLRKLGALEKQVTKHDSRFTEVFAAMRTLAESIPAPRKPIGFRP